MPSKCVIAPNRKQLFLLASLVLGCSPMKSQLGNEEDVCFSECQESGEEVMNGTVAMGTLTLMS